MNIPISVIQTVENSAAPIDNSYFNHAEKAIQALDMVTPNSYCYDYMSNAINALERLYKGFLKAATKVCDWYRLPSETFLTDDHDILGMVLEIKDNFPDVFPRVEREVWRETKRFLRDLRAEYSHARYDTYPTYEEFRSVLEYIKSQQKLLTDYIKRGTLEETNDRDMGLDY